MLATEIDPLALSQKLAAISGATTDGETACALLEVVASLLEQAGLPRETEVATLNEAH